MEDLESCPNEYEVCFVFDRNMLYADAFASQVKSVDVKVYDSQTGREVYSYTEAGEALAAEGYSVSLPVAPGQYDILCWGSMAEGDSFGYAAPAAKSLHENSVVLNTENGTSRRRLNNLFHGLTRGFTFIDNNEIGSRDKQTATVFLTKDTNRINVILHNLDGTEMDDDDFTFTITSRNGVMAYDNSLANKTPVSYVPWHLQPIHSDLGASGTEGGKDTRAYVQNSLSAEFSLARLVDGNDSRLDIVRKSDGERIISIPLERNLLLYKGEFHKNMSDQEYLDRKDDFTITFILDRNNNWDSAAMIYINDWATLPIQYQEW